MQRLDKSTISHPVCSAEDAPSLEGAGGAVPTDEECAALLMDVVPLVMRAVRAEMRCRRAEDLSVPQFRVLAFLSYRAGASLSDVAEHVGLTLPAMSRLVDGLVVRGLVDRATCAADRRRVTLALTERGGALLASARQATEARLAELLSGLSPSDRAALAVALPALRRVFTVEHVR